MKKVLLTVLLICVISMVLTACRNSTEDAWDKLGKSIGAGEKGTIARQINTPFGAEPDTYCSKCKKYSEGVHRICPYCGQYIDD